MHILTLTSLFPNSVEPLRGIFIRNRMENYTRNYGHQWSVVAPVIFFPRLPFATFKEYDLQARVPAFEDARGYPVDHPRYLVTPKMGMRFYGSWLSMGARRAAMELHKRKPIDLIDGHYVYPDGQAAVDLGRRLGVPVVLSARGTDLNLFPRFPAIRKRIEKILAGTDHLICVCSELKTVALELGMPEDRISVIGNGVDAARFGPGDKVEARTRLKLPAAAKIILSVGHMTERKGFHILIGALALMQSRKDIVLAIAGDGAERRALENQAADLGVRDRVVFPGAVQNEDLPAWYRAADLFALASSREGWPNVVCEAQATGLPVVATSVWGIPEIISGEDVGLLVPARDPEAFAHAFDRAFAMPWNNDAIARRGGERTWDKVSVKLDLLFETMVKR